MDIIISWNDEKKSIQIPVLPAGFEVSAAQNNTPVYIHDLGEINLKGKRGLYGITLESFFPAQDYGFCTCRPKKPEYYIEKFKRLFENNTTVHLVITQTKINMYCTVETFLYGEEDRNGDVKYSLAFKEYRETDRKNRVTTKEKGETYVWKKGDTWPKVAKKKLGTSKDYKALRKNNLAVIKKAAKKHPKMKEAEALIGYKVVVRE